MTGVIKRVFLLKGFCFVEGADQADYFLHADQIINHPWDNHIRVGLSVVFEPLKLQDGKLRATQARVEGGRQSRKREYP